MCVYYVKMARIHHEDVEPDYELKCIFMKRFFLFAAAAVCMVLAGCNGIFVWDAASALAIRNLTNTLLLLLIVIML